MREPVGLDKLVNRGDNVLVARDVVERDGAVLFDPGEIELDNEAQNQSRETAYFLTMEVNPGPRPASWRLIVCLWTPWRTRYCRTGRQCPFHPRRPTWWQTIGNTGLTV